MVRKHKGALKFKKKRGFFLKPRMKGASREHVLDSGLFVLTEFKKGHFVYRFDSDAYRALSQQTRAVREQRGRASIRQRAATRSARSHAA